MKKESVLLLPLLFAIGCSSDNEPQGENRVPWETTPELKLSMSEENSLKDFSGFGMSFLNSFVTSDEAKNDPNFAISPISLTEAVGMLANVCDNDKNREAMVRTLGFESLQELNSFNEKVLRYLPNNKDGNTLTLANSLWYNQSLTPSLTLSTDLNKYFMASMSPVDFGSGATASIINKWVSDNTNNLIPSICSSGDLTSDLPFILANATYFNGIWETLFDKDKTAMGDFRTYSGEIVKVALMSAEKSGSDAIDDDFSMVRLYYKGTKKYMDIIVPTGDGDIYETAKILSKERYNILVSKLKYGAKKDVKLPKVELDCNYTLNSVLDKMGISLNNMSYGENGLDSFYPKTLIKQRNVLKIDEEGTELASVTSTDVGWANFGEKITIDEPFIFIIGDEASGIVIMAGIVTDPRFKK